MKPRSTNRKLNFNKNTIVRLDEGVLGRINGGIEITERVLPAIRSAAFCLSLTYCHVDENTEMITEPDAHVNDLARALPIGLPPQL
jgi:hypothetical protein